MIDAIAELVRAICHLIGVLQSAEEVARCSALIILEQRGVNWGEFTVKKLDCDRTTVHWGQRRDQVLRLPGLLHPWLVQNVNRIYEWTWLELQVDIVARVNED